MTGLKSGILVLMLLTVLAARDAQGAKLSVDAKMREDTDLSQFYTLLEGNPIANATLMHRHVTVFAPTNQAFQKYKNTVENNLVLYHISNRPSRTDQFGQSLNSELEGNPPLWVTKKHGPKGYEEIYINNAKIIEGSNYESTFGTNEHDKKIQVLHKISEVLEPVLPLRSSELIYNPDAYQFLNQSESIALGNHRVRTFHHRVKVTGKSNVFSSEGRYTFFIPVDEGFKPAPRANKIDEKVIDGHVIPGHVLFTAPTPSNKPYETLAFGDNLKVTISFSTEHSDKGHDKYYVKSDTLLGDSQHPSASVLAEIVKPNIPVKNGVVHLIQNPLMVVDTTVQEFIQGIDKEDGPLFNFYQVIRDQGDEFMKSVSRLSNVTLFAPRNAAWEEPGVKQILQDKNRVKQLLDLHYVKEYLPLDVIERKTIRQPLWVTQTHYSVQTVAPRMSLYFNVVEGPSGNNTVTVEGGGVNATIITANIGATNGIIHIIDRVLGVPYTTVLDKLKTDPTLNSTYHLGMSHGFNERLGDPSMRFTFFAPQDKAWQDLHIMQPSVYKKMFMSDFAYHTKQILERHLVVGEAFTMKKLVEMDKEGKLMQLQSMRDKLVIKVREAGDNEKNRDDENAIRPNTGAGGYQIEWMGKKIKVIRPDVACTNGIIHVIDDVMLRESDIYVTGSGASVPGFILPHLLTLLVAKWLL
ncbi:fasciclin-1 isoform X3 [Nasonia vitripennis]|uniref:FAS1 domain-containing protein n=1 Tax=Nasonia vitripennis TaxID=7425 RepID=A0A7M7ITS2_NASVI|nr:fasciclin-1 isoform X3 [Nasonia vitripennis]